MIKTMIAKITTNDKSNNKNNNKQLPEQQQQREKNNKTPSHIQNLCPKNVPVL